MPVFLQVLALLAVILLVSFRRYFMKRGSKLAELRATLSTVSAELFTKVAAHEKLFARCRELAAEANQARTHANELEAEVSATGKERNLARNAADLAEGRYEAARETTDELSARVRELQARVHELQARVDTLRNESSKAGVAHKKEIDRLLADVDEFKRVELRLTNEVARVSADRDGLRDERDEARGAAIEAVGNMTETGEELRRVRELLDAANTELNRLTEERDLLVTAKNELETELVKARTYRDVVSMLHGRIVNFQDYTDGRYIPPRLKLVEMTSKTASTITPKGARSRGAGVAPKARKVGRS